MDQRKEVDVFHEYIIFYTIEKIGMRWVRLNEELISGLLCNRLLQGLKLSTSKREYG